MAVVPGEAFAAPGYFRLSFALGDDDLGEGVGRIADLLVLSEPLRPRSRTGPGRRRSPRPASSRARPASTSCGSTATTSGGPRAGRPRAARTQLVRRTADGDAPRGPARRLERPHPGARVRRRRLDGARRRRVVLGLGRPAPAPPRRRRGPAVPRAGHARTRSSPRALRYADARRQPRRPAGWCASASATATEREAVNEIVALPARRARTSASRSSHRPGDRPGLRVAAPRSARTAPAWPGSQWDHPNMPWDGTELRWAASTPDGTGRSRASWSPAARPSRSSQPTWTADGGAAGRRPTATGWWNVYRFTGGDLVLDEPEPLTPIDAEIGGPHWVFGLSWFAVLPDGTLVVSLGADGLQSVGVVPAGLRPGRAAGHAVHRGRPAARRSATASSRWSAAGRRRGDRRCAPLRGRGPARDRGAAAGRDLGLDPAHVLGARADRVPDRRRPHRARPLYPPTNPTSSALARRAAAAAGAEPRRADLGGAAVLSLRHAVLDQPGLRGGRRQLRRQHRLRPAVPRAAERHVGHRRRRRLRRRGRAPRRRRPGRPRAARDPRRQRRRLHHAVRPGLPRHVQRRGQPLRRRPTSRRWPATRTSSSPATSTAWSGRTRTTSSVYRERSPIHHIDGFAVPAHRLPGPGGRGRAARPGRDDRRGAAGQGLPVAYVAVRGRAARLPPGRRTSCRSLEAELCFYGKVFGFDPADDIEPVTDATGSEGRASRNPEARSFSTWLRVAATWRHRPT